MKLKMLLSSAVVALAACGGGGGSATKVILPDAPINNAQAQSSVPASNGLLGWDVINTGPFPCDSQLRQFSWTNPLAKPMKVLMVRQWTGLDYSLESDMQASTMLLDSAGSLMSIMVHQQLDNYKVRSFEQERWVSYAPSWITIPIGGRLLMNAICNKISGGSNAHVMLAIWFYAE